MRENDPASRCDSQATPSAATEIGHFVLFRWRLRTGFFRVEPGLSRQLGPPAGVRGYLPSRISSTTTTIAAPTPARTQVRSGFRDPVRERRER